MSSQQTVIQKLKIDVVDANLRKEGSKGRDIPPLEFSPLLKERERERERAH